MVRFDRTTTAHPGQVVSCLPKRQRRQVRIIRQVVDAAADSSLRHVPVAVIDI